MLGLLTTVTSLLRPVLAFIIILVPLVVFHEFGHFIFAKLFGVKAEIFSVGFGPRLWSRQYGETEFRVSAIPMGGYVKLLGEDRDAELPAEDAKRSLHQQAPWKRFFIFFGGPLFNFLLAIMIFMVILALGEPQMASFVGRVVQGSVAEQAGFRSGDEILEVNQHPVKKFEEVAIAMNESPDTKINFRVLHPGESQSVIIEAKTSSEEGLGTYGESTHVGQIDGLLPFARATQVGVSNPRSPAALAGITTGDQLVRFGGKPVKTWEEVETLYRAVIPGTPISVQVEKVKGLDGSKKQVELTFKKPDNTSGLGADVGLFSSELFVERVVSKSPAEQIGLKSGDRLIGVGESDPQSFFQLRENVQKSGEKDGSVKVRWERMGQSMEGVAQATATPIRDVSLNKKTQYTIGVAPMLVLAEPPTVVERVLNPVRLVIQATERMVQLTWRNLVSLRKMAAGEVSTGQLGGPLTIGKIAGESLSRGLIVFLTNMAIFSIGLGVLNILPVPVLDGGHLLLLGIETVRGKPLSPRQMEIVQGIGLLFILALMGKAFYNDIARLIYS